MMLRTEMCSVRPGTPGRRQQMPRTNSSTSVPASLARTSRAITSASFMELTLMPMYPAGPRRVCASMCAISCGL